MRYLKARMKVIGRRFPGTVDTAVREEIAYALDPSFKKEKWELIDVYEEML
jgi:hypothetical protein